MALPAKLQATSRLAVLLAFVGVCVLIFGYLWVNSGGRIIGVSPDGYEVSFAAPATSNLVNDSDVMIAGVKVGKVASLGVKGNSAEVTMRLTSSAPLHQGATVQVRQKTLVEETYLEITDGKGRALPDHTTLPAGSAKPAVSLSDVLQSLDAKTRSSLGSTINSLGAVTADSRADISDALSGLGSTGREGKTVLSALSSQSGDLRNLTSTAASLLAALNGRQADLASLVRSANSLTQATSDSAPQLAQAMRELPGLMTTARSASGSLTTLGRALQPVADNLDAAAPDLTTALRALPSTANDLRGLLPSLNTTLDRAPATLETIPGFASSTSSIVPGLQVDLSDLNPMLSYVEPYGPEVAAFFSNFAQTLATGDANGKMFRVFALFNAQSVKNLPISTNVGPFNQSNPYPKGGTGQTPGSFTGTYPRVTRSK